jgi:dTDP-4-amino-4,6-dideoxygalactose transaminase
MPDKKEVILPAYTCPAVVSAILKANLTPILCDNNLYDFGLDTKELEGKINKNTLAVMVVHLLGYPANIIEVKELCKNKDIYVVEDAAQSFGNNLPNSDGQKLGLVGDVGFFSFGRGKPISILHGGVLITKSEEIYQSAKKTYNELNFQNGCSSFNYRFLLSLYALFANPYLYWISQRVPFLRLGETIFESEFEISKGLGVSVNLINEILLRFEKEKEIRRENSKWYYEKSGLNSCNKTNDYPYLRFPYFAENRIIRDKLLDYLTSKGTGAARFYPCPLNELPGLKDSLQDSNTYPNAKEISDRLITLPVHSGVSTSNRQKIIQIIKRFVH